jgi:SSS family solute:Na+ symporter
MRLTLTDWIVGCIVIYMTLWGVGKVIFGQALEGLSFLDIAGVTGWITYWDLNRRGWKTVME